MTGEWPEIEVPGGQAYELVGDAVIGRGTESDIPIDDPEISRRHALIRVTPGYCTVEDLGSRNGTFVNGEPIQAAHVLATGDVIRVGQSDIAVRLPWSMPVPEPEPEPEPEFQQAMTMVPPTGIFSAVPPTGILEAYQDEAPVPPPPPDDRTLVLPADDGTALPEPAPLAPQWEAEPAPVAPPPAAAPAFTNALAPQHAPVAAAEPGFAPGSPLQVLARISRRLLGQRDARDLAEAVVEAIQKEAGVEGAALLLWDASPGELYFAAVAPLPAEGLRLIRLQPGEGFAGRVMAQGQPLLVRDVTSEPGHARRVDDTLGYVTRSLVAAPVVDGSGRVFGVLEAVNPIGRTWFEQEDADLLALVAQQLGLALVAASSWESLERDRDALGRVAAIRDAFVAGSPEMLRLVRDAASRHAAGRPVYLWGEPGSGRGLLARLTAESLSADGTAANVDCATNADPAAAIAAGSDRPVVVENLPVAPPAAQLALAQAIAARPAGAPGVIATGEGDLSAEVANGRLALALLGVFEGGQLRVPPLRERTREIGALASRFLAQFAEQYGRPPLALTDDAIELLRNMPWPGNMAELEAAMRRVSIVSRQAGIDAPALEALLAPGHMPASEAGGSALERRRADVATQLREALFDASPATRLAAVRAAGQLGVPAANHLEPVLNDPDSAVRTAAAEVLARATGQPGPLFAALLRQRDPASQRKLLGRIAEFPGPASVEVVAACLQAPDDDVRHEAMRTLRAIGSPAEVPFAHQAAADPSPAVRAAALAALAHWGAQDASQLLALSAEGAPGEQAAACIALGDLHLGAKHIMSALGDPDPAVRAAAAMALTVFPQPLAEKTLTSLINDPAVEEAAVRALAVLRSPTALSALAEVVADETRPAPAREAAIEGVGAIGDTRATPLLAACLSDDSVALAAIRAMQTMADRTAEPALAACLAQPAEDVRLAAASALGANGTAVALPALLDAAAESSPSGLAAFEAALAVARREPWPTIAPALEQALASPASMLAARELLGELSDSRAVPILLRHVSEHPDAAPLLVRLGRPGLDALLDAARTSPELRTAVEAGLGELAAATPGAVLALLHDDALRGSAAAALAAAGDQALYDVVAAAEGESSPPVLAHLVQLIGRIAGGRFAQYLCRFLDSPEPSVARAALVALGDAESEAAQRELARRIDSSDPVTASLAIAALGRTGSQEAFDRLVQESEGDGDPRVHFAVAAAMASYNLRQPAIQAAVARMVLAGRPFEGRAFLACVQSGALQSADIEAALASAPAGRQARIIRLLGSLPAETALPLLAAAAAHVGGSARPMLAAALAAFGEAAEPTIAALARDAGLRDIALEALRRLGPPDSVSRLVLELARDATADPALAADLRELGEDVLGPLLDTVAEHWDVHALETLWDLAGVNQPHPVPAAPA